MREPLLNYLEGLPVVRDPGDSKFLIDANLSPRVSERLDDAGHNSLHVAAAVIRGADGR